MEYLRRLPFAEHPSAGLGILTKIYLDELATLGQQPLDVENEQKIMSKAEGWLVHTDVTGSFKLSCELWDAVYEGIKESDASLIKEEDRAAWNEADARLAPRRKI